MQQHKERGEMVERICKYPPSLDRNGNFIAEEQPVPKTARYISRLDSNEYMRMVRATDANSYQNLG